MADSVAAAFDTHQFVFIGSTHGGKKPHDFLLCLLSRPVFQRRATDILVEWGNPFHQALVDRYLLALDPVPLDSLRPVWVDTDAPQLWGRLPLIPELYEAVRSINGGLEPARRIRVLGGCEPIAWSAVTTAADVARYPFKNNWAAHVIAEHFAPDPERRLLVVYGDGHIHHNGGSMMGNLYATIDRAELFVVGTIDSLESGDEERVARLGDPARPFFVSGARLPAAGPYPRALFYARANPLAQHVDAVAYLGPEPDREPVEPDGADREREGGGGSSRCDQGRSAGAHGAPVWQSGSLVPIPSRRPAAGPQGRLSGRALQDFEWVRATG